MNTDQRIQYSVVVPFFNEQENVPPLYVKITEVLDTLGAAYEMVFVDDGSGDQTFKVLAEIHEHDHRVNVVRLRRNFGQTAALKAGFDFARGEIIIAMDGDLQHDPANIPRFLEKLREGFDIVCGWRQQRQQSYLTRRLPSQVANWLIRKISRVPIHDFGGTFKVYRREILEDLHLYGEMHRFIPALASWRGAKIAEIPVQDRPRVSGKSKYGFSRTIRVFLDLITIKFLLDYATKPIQFFGLFGLLGIGAGSLISLAMLYKKVVLGLPVMGPLLLLGLTLVMSGIQFLSLGLLGEILARTYFESQNKSVYAVREIKSRRHEAHSRSSHDASPPRT
jgi:glycosyltransferase involved in cell wall biosynthesis